MSGLGVGRRESRFVQLRNFWPGRHPFLDEPRGSLRNPEPVPKTCPQIGMYGKADKESGGVGLRAMNGHDDERVGRDATSERRPWERSGTAATVARSGLDALGGVGQRPPRETAKTRSSSAASVW